MIGPSGIKFSVHSKLIGDLSPALHACLNNGAMKESIERTVVWENLEPDVFAAVCQFAWHGSYESPVLLSSRDMTTLDSESTTQDDSKSKEKKGLPPSTFLRKFQSRANLSLTHVTIKSQHRLSPPKW